MTCPTPDLHAPLKADFDRARERLIEARLQQQMKDTPHHRATVAVCRARIDTVLDLYLTVGAAQAGPPAAAPGRSGPSEHVAAAAQPPSCAAAPGAA
jgi:hypothetical protein